MTLRSGAHARRTDELTEATVRQLSPLAHGPSTLLIAEDGEVWMVQPLQRRLTALGPCVLRRARSILGADADWVASRDLIFVRSRSPGLLVVLGGAEARGALVVNAVNAIRSARHRATAIALVAASGVPTAHDYEGPLASVPFERAVLKRRNDDGRSVPVLYERNERASPRTRTVYAQSYIRSAWEYKVYVVGDELFAFVQRPTMEHPDKLSTRRRVPVDPVLGGYARRAAKAVGLEIAGIDFLFDRDRPRVTDVNSNQGLHTFAEGYEALEGYLRGRMARRARARGSSRT
jgi:glutathione synthase/RimK-type ligase-like ATP-grasp enzyme